MASVPNEDLGSFVSFPSTWAPDWMVHSSWTGHAPFAFWLMSELRPRAFVELGVHRGYSYMAFCQAAKNLGLDTRCYGIDTWQGDEHAGEYGSEVFTALEPYHNNKYRSFSTLLEMTFDEASSYFESGSIDLLHIDGRHFYDDVKHDFETWKHNLSNTAVVLLHDTDVRERQFGVWKFWREMQKEYPSFEFHHGHGLGVLGVGAEIPKPIELLCGLEPERAAHVRSIYARLGGVLAELRNSVGDVDRAKGEREQATSALQREVRETQALREQLERLERALRDHRGAMNELKKQVSELREEGEAYRSQMLDARGQLDAIVNSTIWRSAAPLRAAARGLPRPVRRVIRGSMRLAYWGLTPRAIPRRVRAMRGSAPGEPPVATAN